MKGQPEVITMLNQRLAEEHTAIIQYVTHAGMCENWGYKRLSAYMNKRAQDEMKHVGMLMDRILFLDGLPTLQNLGEVNIAESVEQMFEFDHAAELAAIAGYTEGIDVCGEFKDYGTKKLLCKILEDEDEHLNGIEEDMTQIMQMGIENYLPAQIKA